MKTTCVLCLIVLLSACYSYAPLIATHDIAVGSVIRDEDIFMKHTLSFPKSVLAFPTIRLEIGIDTDNCPYTGFLVSRLPPDGQNDERVRVIEPEGE